MWKKLWIMCITISKVSLFFLDFAKSNAKKGAKMGRVLGASIQKRKYKSYRAGL